MRRRSLYLKNKLSHRWKAGRLLEAVQVILGQDEEAFFPPGEEPLPLLPQQSPLERVHLAPARRTDRLQNTIAHNRNSPFLSSI